MHLEEHVKDVGINLDIEEGIAKLASKCKLDDRKAGVESMRKAMGI